HRNADAMPVQGNRFVLGGRPGVVLRGSDSRGGRHQRATGLLQRTRRSRSGRGAAGAPEDALVALATPSPPVHLFLREPLVERRLTPPEYPADVLLRPVVGSGERDDLVFEIVDVAAERRDRDPRYGRTA